MKDPAPSDEQFNPLAKKYAESPVHREGPSLRVLLEYAEAKGTDAALDVATGTGHTALALSSRVKRVIGVDIANKMLDQARALAENQAAANTSFVRAAADALPFADASFDLVTSRHAPHHFPDPAGFLREIKRVLKPGGRAIMADQVSLTLETQRWVDQWERTRDPSHFKQWTPEEWKALAEATGFQWIRHEIVRYPLEFGWWTRQVNAAAETVQSLKEQVQSASTAVRELYQFEFNSDGELTIYNLPVMVVRLEPA